MAIPMKVLLVSNIISPHQLPLANELRSIVGNENFVYAAMKMPDREREKLGWKVESSESWVITPAENSIDHAKFKNYWKEFDVVICGERLFDEMLERVGQGKLCFYMSERWWKPPLGRFRLLSMSFLRMALKFKLLSSSPLFHYLPTGPHAAMDINLISNLDERIWNWGYFTSDTRLRRENQKIPALKVMWAGRMLKWKSVDVIIKAISSQNKGDAEIKLSLIGEGPERKSLEYLAGHKLKPESFTFQNFVPSDQIPKIMADNDVYILSSTDYEGWGAVINEAMSVGCVVVASNGAGAAVAMIEDGVDGFLFDVGDWKHLSKILSKLAENKEYCKQIGINARSKIERLWSPKVGANRFVSVVEALLNDENLPEYVDGPMSRSWNREV